MAGPAQPGQRRGRGRREEHGELARAGQPVLEHRGDHASRGVGRAARHRGPVLAELDQQPLAVHGRLGARGHVHPDQRAVVAAQVDLGGVEVQRALDEGAGEAGGVVVPGVHGQVLGLAGEDLGRIGQRRAAAPQPHGAGVPGGGRAARTEVRGDQHGVQVDPAERALGLRAQEPAVLGCHPGQAHQVELSCDVGVRATVRQRDQGAPEVRAQHLRPVPDPVLLLGGVERVEVQDHLPVRLGGPVRLPGGPPPQPARVLGIPPEVVEAVADEGGLGDLVRRVEDLPDRVTRRGEGGGRGRAGEGLGVALADPGHRVGAVDLLEPGVRVDCIDGARVGHGAPA